MWRVDYIHDKGEAASLELLGSPAVLGIAESLAGPDFVPTYESLVVKKAGDGAPVPWHQDASYWPLTPSKAVTVWLAIDDADPRAAWAVGQEPGGAFGVRVTIQRVEA